MTALSPPPDYQPFYCEENAWRLAARLAAAGGAPQLVFISNPLQQVVLFAQRAANAHGYVVWDYHVVVRADGWIHDLDCTAGSPLPLAAWIAASFPHVGQAPPQYDPLFRVVPWAVAQGEFTSDRRHMRAADGAWLQPPPPWPPISRPAAPHRLPDFVAMGPGGPGRVVDLATFGSET
ncbi:MAG: hypothetical protein H6702_20860 [Myxococcales bacterium]|nr:hypothetical protein [Myxococcales bacterium]